MAYQRQMGEPVDLRAALPVVGKISPYDYDSALRQRLRPTDDIGTQQNMFAAQQAEARQRKAYEAKLAQLQQQGQMIQARPGTPGAVQAPNGKWYHPLGNGMRPTFGYGAAYKNPVAGRTSHAGVDFAVARGTPVYAPGAGTLKSYGFGKTGFGNEIRLQLGNYLGILGHLSAFAPGLKPGMSVTPGMLLGYVGSTGNSSGNHLHYEMRDQYGNPFNFNSWYGW